jgi:hypothetical protein
MHLRYISNFLVGDGRIHPEVVWGVGASAVAFPAKLGFDELLYTTGASSWDVMLVGAGITALLAAMPVMILVNCLRHSRATQMEHVRRIYSASD